MLETCKELKFESESETETCLTMYDETESETRNFESETREILNSMIAFLAKIHFKQHQKESNYFKVQNVMEHAFIIR